MSELLSQLNEHQREAAACTEGPVMIIAGAGSGKTRTLTFRIAHLMEKGVDPFRILALTFTNKAAKEMRDRITGLVGNEAKSLWMGTFHSVFARVLRAEAERLGYTSSFTIYDTDDTKAAIKHVVKALNLDPKTYKPATVLSRISMAKSNLLSPKDYQENPEVYQTDIDARRPAIGQIYQMYDQRLRNSNAMDFDDLLFNMNILLRDFPDVLLKYQNRFQYIMVDEYQDTNFAQYLIVKKLAARHQNICVVGDDAQSIYAFRGANIQNIFNFRRDYPEMHLYKLEQNYRSTKTIVQAANSIIEHNRDQIQKELWSDNADGQRIRLLRADDEKNEGSLVADAIQHTRLDADADYRDFAILYRQNSLSRAVEDALRRLNIPYRIYQGLSFYGRREVKDVLAYLRLAVNPCDDESLVRVINYPARGIGQTTLDRIRVAAADNDVPLWTVLENIQDFGLPINSGIVQKITEFVYLIKRFQSQVDTLDAFTLAKQIVGASGIVKALREEDEPDTAERIDNIDELLNGIAADMECSPHELAERWEKVLAMSDCLLLEDLAVIKERDPQWYASLKSRGIHNIILYEIRYKQSLVGFVWAANFNTEKLMQIKKTLELSSFLLGAVIQNHQLINRLEERSSVDGLTQVSNRNAMNDRVDKLVSGEDELPETMGIVFADLNGLKNVNDDEGHDAGDRLLTRAAGLLKIAFGDYEIYRAGGDEFVIFMPDTSEDVIEKQAAQLSALTENTADVRFAVGTSYCTGKYDICQAMQLADERMYKDKEEYYRLNPDKDRRKRHRE